MNVYLDYQAAKPLDKRVLEEMLPFFRETYANPASLHCEGDIATKALEEARGKVASFINAPESENIIFTSSATESNNLALIGGALRNKRKGNHVIISDIEHISILNIAKYLEREGFKVNRVPVDQYGIIKLDKLKRLIRDETILISIAGASNEVGSLQPVKEISELAQENGILFHSDAVPIEPTIPIDVEEVPYDFLTLSSNDIYGPRGVGALYLRKGQRVNPIIIGGGQERGMRSGSHNMSGIVGFGKAAEIMKNEIGGEAKRLASLRDELIKGVLEKIPKSYLNGHPEKRLPHNAHFRFDYIEGESLILGLKDENVAAATGSACSSKTLEASHTLIAMGLLHEEAHGSLVITLGRYSDKYDIVHILNKLPDIVKRLRKLSPLTPPDLLQKYSEVKD